jgi:hypothetical protein
LLRLSFLSDHIGLIHETDDTSGIARLAAHGLVQWLGLLDGCANSMNCALLMTAPLDVDDCAYLKLTLAF